MNATQAPLRHDRETGGFQYRCMSCYVRGNDSWWPLDEEFWNYARGFSRCRACWRTHDRLRIRERRKDPAYRERDRRYAADYYASLSSLEIAIRGAKRREYHRDWMRAYRARKAAA